MPLLHSPSSLIHRPVLRSLPRLEETIRLKSPEHKTTEKSQIAPIHKSEHGRTLRQGAQQMGTGRTPTLELDTT